MANKHSWLIGYVGKQPLHSTSFGNHFVFTDSRKITIEEIKELQERIKANYGLNECAVLSVSYLGEEDVE